LLNWV